MLDVSRAGPPAELDAVFFALCDGTRRQLLGRLKGAELTAGALADGFAVTRPAVSRHLRILREAQLVSERRRGRERVYTLTPEPLAAATGWLDEYRVFWAARLNDLKALVESLSDEEVEAAAARAAQAAPSSSKSPAPPTTSASPSGAADPTSPPAVDMDAVDDESSSNHRSRSPR
jgi:DNA-binding transcriptional ArsR family regulator